MQKNKQPYVNLPEDVETLWIDTKTGKAWNVVGLGRDGLSLYGGDTLHDIVCEDKEITWEQFENQFQTCEQYNENYSPDQEDNES